MWSSYSRSPEIPLSGVLSPHVPGTLRVSLQAPYLFPPYCTHHTPSALCPSAQDATSRVLGPELQLPKWWPQPWPLLCTDELQCPTIPLEYYQGPVYQDPHIHQNPHVYQDSTTYTRTSINQDPTYMEQVGVRGMRVACVWFGAGWGL